MVEVRAGARPRRASPLVRRPARRRRQRSTRSRPRHLGPAAAGRLRDSRWRWAWGPEALRSGCCQFAASELGNFCRCAGVQEPPHGPCALPSRWRLRHHRVAASVRAGTRRAPLRAMLLPM